MKKSIACTAFFALIVIAAGVVGVQANPRSKGDRILRKYEKSFSNFKDQYARFRMVIHEKSGKKNVEFTLYNRPGWTRLMRFTDPGDVRGQSILVMSRQEMYIWLPAYRRVRRIAGHVRNQGFMGSVMTFDDMAIGQWSGDYDARFLKEDANHWYIRLTPKKGKNVAFPQLWMKIEKNMRQAVEIRYLSEKGRLLRTQTMTGWSCEQKDKHCAPKRVRMVDHRQGNATTDLILLESNFNHGIPDRYFTVRHLQRGG